MDDSLTRLAWALPLVLVIGVGVIWLLQRWPGLLARASAAQPALAVTQSLPLSDKTTAYVLEVEGRRLVVIESARAIQAVEIAPSVRRSNPWVMQSRGRS